MGMKAIFGNGLEPFEWTHSPVLKWINMSSPGSSEKKLFESVDDGQMMDPAYTKSSLGALGSSKLNVS